MKKKIYSLLLSVAFILPCIPSALADTVKEEYKGFGYEHIVESKPLELIDFEY